MHWQQDHLDAEAVVRGNTWFALDLYRRLRDAQGNLFLSPYSISTALAVAYAGARGETERQMAQALHFTLDQERLHPAWAALQEELNAVAAGQDILLNVANALWPQAGCPLLEEYVALTQAHYGVPVTSLDYRDPQAACHAINGWVDEKTGHKIRELMQADDVNELTRLVLANAIYFKGNWASQFDRALTRDAPFWVTPADQLGVPTMFQKRPFRYAENEHAQILELPYAGEDLSMIVLLPRQRDGLAGLEDALDVETLETWTGHLRPQEVVVILPRFKLESQFRLDAALMSMGVVDAFDIDKANLAGIDGRDDWLYISAVIHKAFIDVNEEGSEAAAATAGVMSLLSVGPPLPAFRADHPFVFLMRDKRTGSILFLGRMVNPAWRSG
jgi:serine protease inhibitor